MPVVLYLETELSSLDGSDVTTGTTTDDNEVQLLYCSACKSRPVSR